MVKAKPSGVASALNKINKDYYERETMKGSQTISIELISVTIVKFCQLAPNLILTVQSETFFDVGRVPNHLLNLKRSNHVGPEKAKI